jgi:hypothetical protein
MADAKLTALTAASALAAADLFYVSQSAASRKATGTQLLALVGTAYVPLAGGTMTGALTIASGTLTASAPALSITQTWNSGATTFTGALINITNTASSGASRPINVQIAGTSIFAIRPDGYAFASAGLQVGSGGTNGLWDAAGPRVKSTGYFSWAQSANATDTADLFLYRDAAGSLAQRNGTNAQTLRVYRSYTDASNYSRFTHSWNTSTALLMAEGLGTGTDGNIAFNDAALATGATLGYIMVPSAAGVSTGRPADIPTGQTPIVFDSTNKKIGAYTGGAWVWTAALA